jgi:hypothetical protein
MSQTSPTTESPPVKSKNRRQLSLPAATVIAPLILVAGGLAGHFIGQNPTPASPSPTQTHSSKPTPPPITMAFRDPQQGARIKQCPRIDGTGNIPPGMGLWIIVLPKTTLYPKQYWIGGEAHPDGTGFWSVNSSVSIDDRNTRNVTAEIYAVLLDKGWSNYFAKSVAEGYFWSSVLPPVSNERIIGPVTVTRIRGRGICH